MGGAGSTPHTMAAEHGHGHGRSAKKYQAHSHDLSSVREIFEEVGHVADAIIHTLVHKGYSVIYCYEATCSASSRETQLSFLLLSL
jgi:hypothetical protein